MEKGKTRRFKKLHRIAEKLSIELLNEVEIETKRFLKKLTEAKKRIKEDSRAAYGSKETGAIKRASLDLKNELTRISQSQSY